MDQIGQAERKTQNRIIRLFSERLGYQYLGDWEERNNSNIEENLLRNFLQRKDYPEVLINRALDKLRTNANNPNESLYNNNKNTYQLLRYGVKVKAEAGENFETVHLIDWQYPEANHFTIAEEVTIKGGQFTKRPDVVLYVNGIAVAVLEFKNGRMDIGEGIRQSINNQRKEFIEHFFSTVQFVFAGNDTEGLKYGTVGTEEKYFLRWKEDESDSSTYEMDKYLSRMCRKERLIELMYDFVLFDAGVKKLPRVHQYFGIKAAQEHIKRREGGIIWHTQGSGKSIVMVLLAKWILENKPDARVAIITDRDELDKQIQRVFEDSGEEILRTKSGKDLMFHLSQPKPRLLCSLVHKFGRKDVDNFEAYIEELKNNPTPAFGDLYVFVDECHRTQSGKLHKVMKALLPDAVFIGFTGTPLLKQDKQTSMEVFGSYIHTYKFNEAVEDEVVLDLMYEARDIEQRLTSQEKIDAWFESKTKGLNDFQKSEIKKKWGTMQRVLSSKNRMEQIVNDIRLDFSVKPRLSSNTGNAILVASSIYEASRYFELFQQTEFKGRCAIITSYNPSHRDIVTEDTGANTETDKQYIYNTYIKLLNGQQTEKYEEEAKTKFRKEPANMRLLIVVDKLLTGFDAPSCTYLYIDKSMQDHGLFQAICRVNRLDGETKDFGYIVDYKDLFPKVENAVSVYTSEMDYDNFKKEDCEILLKDRLAQGKKRLEDALEELALICEHVAQPRSDLEYIRYFCGNPENPDDLKAHEARRTMLYKGIVSLIRAYANIANELEEAGYSHKEIEEVKAANNNYLRLREIIRKASGETIDLKAYEADMRFLIDKFIQAKDSVRIDPFEDQSLLEIIVNSGIAEAVNSLPDGIKSKQEAIAETIENNVRQKIIKEHLIDPAYFDKMSKLLENIIKELRNKQINYKEYLEKMAELARNVQKRDGGDFPPSMKTNALKALYNNLEKNEDLALACDIAVRYNKLADFRGDDKKENVIKHALYQILKDEEEVERIFRIIEKQDDY